MWQPNYTPPALWQPPSPGGSSPRTPPSDSGTPTKQRVTGRRFGQVIRLKKECLEEYKTLHAKAWPEVLKQIKDCNIEDYCIWYDDATGMLFSSFKYYGWDYTGDMERMAENSKVREWWKITDAMQESLVEGAVSSEAGAPGWWKPVEEVFYTA